MGTISKENVGLCFSLRPKSKGRCSLKCLLLDEGNGLSKEVWVGREWKHKLWSRGLQSFFIKKSIIGKILAVRLQGTLWARNRVGCSFEFGVGLGLWRLHTKLQLFELRGRGSSWPRVWTLSLTFGGFTLYPAKAPLTIFYWLFSAHFFRISTKFGHSTRTAIV
jgi:hypothetical protein